MLKNTVKTLFTFVFNQSTINMEVVSVMNFMKMKRRNWLNDCFFFYKYKWNLAGQGSQSKRMRVRNFQLSC